MSNMKLYCSPNGVNKTHKNSVLNAGSECTCVACVLLHHPGVSLLLWLDLAATLMNLEKILLGLNVLRAGAGVSLPSWIHVWAPRRCSAQHLSPGGAFDRPFLWWSSCSLLLPASAWLPSSSAAPESFTSGRLETARQLAREGVNANADACLSRRAAPWR